MKVKKKFRGSSFFSHFFRGFADGGKIRENGEN